MFTGIIESLGTLKKIQPNGQGKILGIDTDINLFETKIGDSIAVNGVCLTVVKLNKNFFEVDAAPETVLKTTFKKLNVGDKLNIERALRFSDRLDGHLVSGHVDGTGIIVSKVKKSNAVIITIKIDSELALQLIQKGSVAVDGISLTINRCSDNDFEVSIIPHTGNITTIGLKNIGDEVNIETDMLGKYVKKFLLKSSEITDINKNNINMEFLVQKGFL